MSGRCSEQKPGAILEDLPNVFIVGAAKSGTSSLAAYLGQHPEVFVSGIKEPAYYINDAGYTDWDEYRSLYRGVTESIRIDASTGYLFEPTAADRIRGNHPDAKILILLRNPIDMAFSYWLYNQVDGNESKSFMDAISPTEVKYRHSESFRRQCQNWWCSYLYIDRASYYRQVKRYLDIFGRKSVRVYIFEDFIKRPVDVLHDIVGFLGLKKYDFEVKKVVNKGGAPRSRFVREYIYNRRYPLLRRFLPPKVRENIRFFVRDLNRSSRKPRLDPDQRVVLASLLSEDVSNLESLLGYKIESWGGDFRHD